jgi:hypothetical protein
MRWSRRGADRFPKSQVKEQFMSKKAKTPPTPPTVLVITLEADGNGSLLARRGDLAHLSQFTYRGMSEIITAIQSGAAQLADLEQHPPVLESEAAPSTEPPVETSPAPDEPDPTAEETASQQVATPDETAAPVPNLSDSQARLF